MALFQSLQFNDQQLLRYQFNLPCLSLSTMNPIGASRYFPDDALPPEGKFSYQASMHQKSNNSPMPALRQRRLDPTYVWTQIRWLRSSLSTIALHGANKSLLKVKAICVPLPMSLTMRASGVKYALTRVAELQQYCLHTQDHYNTSNHIRKCFYLTVHTRPTNTRRLFLS